MFRHVREQQDDFKFRKDRAVFESVSQVIINTYQSHLRRKGIDRPNEPTKDDYIEFKNNVDLEGHNLDYYLLERVFPASQAMGFCDVVIDFPMANEVNSEYERKEIELRPYLTCYYPIDRINWEWSRGKFNWVVYREYEFQGGEIFETMKESQKRIEVYKYWDSEKWVKYDQNRKILDGGTNQFSQVPVSIFYNRESLLYQLPVGMSALKIIAEIDKKIFNLSSLLDEFLYRQCFVQLILDKDTIGTIIETGTTKALPVGEDELEPRFLEPPTGGAEFIVSERNRLIDSCYRYAMVRGDSHVTEKMSESGVSKAYDLHDSNQNIAQKSKNMESSENRIHELLENYYGEVKATYPDNFDIKTLNEEIQETIEIFKTDIGSITYAREKAFQLVKRDLQKADPELLKKIRDEIDMGNPVLDFTQLLEGIREGVLSREDIIKTFYPNAKESEIKAQVEKITSEKQAMEGKKPEPSIKELLE